MAVDVLDRLGLSILPRDSDARDASSFGLQNTERRLGLLSQPPLEDGSSTFFEGITASELRTAISRLSRRGHARFRRAPGGSSYTKPPEAMPSSLQVCSASNVGEVKVQAYSLLQSTPNVSTSKPHLSMRDSPCSPSKEEQGGASFDAMVCARMMDMDRAHVSTSKMEQTVDGRACHEDNDAVAHATHDLQGVNQTHRADMDRATLILQPPTATASSFMSSLSTEGGTVTNTTLAKQSICNGLPPLPPKKRKPVEQIEELSKKHHRSRTCHCVKHRKSKGTRVVRVSAIGLQATEIPADGHTWCKYGQKTNKGSSTTRGYYRCISFHGCPARKHVERAFDDLNTFIVTYGRDHVHLPIPVACI